ncbi:hypothetical protein BGZ46_004591 [Entomortierella lignicola]|nr:hypothetical protein BGZ46_004591 [Entomortierella lignicola]
MAAVSDFSTKVSKHVLPQRLVNPVFPLTEANLYRHTITSPPSRDAKLKHILNYVEIQKELIALEEEMYQSVLEKGRWRNTISNNPTRSDLVLELHSSQPSAPHLRHNQQEHLEEEEQKRQQTKQNLYQDISEFYQRPSKQRVLQQSPPTASALYPHQQQHYQQRYQNHGGLDPSIALPRALPRNTTNLDQSYYRDSFYSGIGQENEWRQLGDLDPDSLAGIQIYGDTTDFQFQSPSQFSPAAQSSPLNKYPIYEYVATKKSTEWQQERHLQQLQQQAILKQLQNPDENDEFTPEIASRHQRSRSASVTQQQQRQLISPPPTFVEKEKKAGRFISRFSFLTRRRQGGQQHQRHESMPALTKEAWTSESNSGARVNSPLIRADSRGAAAAMAIGESLEQDEEIMHAERPVSVLRNGSRVKKIIKDVFGLSKRKNSSEAPFRNISLPSTHIRSTPSPHHHSHQQHLDPSVNSQHNYSTLTAQRKGLVTPESRPGTAQSNYPTDMEFTNNNHHSYYNNNYNSYNNRGKKITRESLVDPIQIQPFAYQKMELDGDEFQGLDVQDSESVLLSPFAHTSLTPPPASSVLRHSTISHRAFNGPVLVEEPTLIATGAGGVGEQYKARRSSQLMPIPKESIDSGCDSMGHEPYATASNATTLNQTAQLLQQQQGSTSNTTLQHNPNPSFDNDRRSTLTMTMSMYDNGPAMVSLGQVQKVDLEGLRQNHQHHSPPSPSRSTPPPPLPTASVAVAAPQHSHAISMIAVEAPFA